MNSDISNSIIPLGKIEILVSEEDKYGENILTMSDFFGNYINQLSTSISSSSVTKTLPDIPFADLGILCDVIHQAEVIIEGTTQLIPDFDNIPSDIRKKLKDGVYKIGKSRQVDGNLRAVIVDETNTRVKDITLKEVQVNPNVIETSRSITNQLQLRQIYAKLDSIQEMQEFQVARDRDRDIKVPFRNARDHILLAQGDNCSKEDKKQELEKAAEYLLNAKNNVITEISTSAERLLKLTHRPIFRNIKRINSYIGILTEDLQVLTKVVGLRLQLLDYLGNSDGAKIELQSYQRIINDFFNKKISGSDYTLSELIHSNYPYTKENMNYWYNLGNEVRPKLEMLTNNVCEHIYLVSLEDDKDG